MVWRSTYRRGGKFYLKIISLCCRTQAAGLHKMPKLEVLEAVCPWVFAVPFADRFQFCGLHGLQQLSTRPSWAEILRRTLRVCQCHGLRASVWGQMDPYPLSSTFIHYIQFLSSNPLRLPLLSSLDISNNKFESLKAPWKEMAGPELFFARMTISQRLKKIRFVRAWKVKVFLLNVERCLWYFVISVKQFFQTLGIHFHTVSYSSLKLLLGPSACIPARNSVAFCRIHRQGS